MSSKYQAYLQSEHWQEFRQQVIDFWKERCVVCGDPGRHVHHRNYTRLGQEKITDCCLLCASCHQLFHAKISQLTSFEQWAAECVGEDWREGDQEALRSIYNLAQIYGDIYYG